MRQADRSLSWRTAIFDQVRDPVLVIDAQGRLADLNRAAAGLLGIDPQAAPLPPLAHVLPQAPSLLASRQTGQPAATIITLPGDGSLRSFECLMTALQNPTGTLLQLHDVTEQQRMAARLQEEEARFYRLAEQAPDMIYRARLWPAMAFEYINPIVTSLTGYTPQDHYRDPALGVKLVHPDDLPILMQMQTALPDIDYSRYMIRWISKDGRVLHTEHHCTVIRDAGGRAVAIEGIARDMTATVEAQAALRQSEERYRMLSDDAPLPVVVSDLATARIVYANQRAADLFGLSISQTLGSAAADFYADPADRALLLELLNAHGRVTDFEVRMHTAAGRELWLSLNAICSVYEGRSVVIGVYVDVTQHRQQEEEIRHLNATLEQHVEERTAQLAASNASLAHALRVKDEFLSTMSHELRTPLTGVLSMAEALQEQVYGPLNERQLKYVSTVERSGRHLLALINDILDLSRVDSGRLELNQSQFNVQTVCQASLHMVHEMAMRKQQVLHLRLTPVQMEMVGDYRRIQQMLVNLLGNAVKFTPEGGRIEVRAEGDPSTQTVTFSVQDTGIGIGAADIPRLFQPFVQLDSGLARQYTGTGLGLALVRRLAELHGGYAGVASTLGEGSRFYITLPWWQIPSSTDTAATEPAAAPMVAVTPSALILVADDDPINVEIVADYLGMRGYTVATAEDGEAALRQWEKLRPNLILMDIHMPGTDGLEAIRRIRSHADHALARTPIIALTALAMPGDRERCLAAGADDYLSKPMSFAALITALEAQLHGEGAADSSSKESAF